MNATTARHDIRKVASWDDVDTALGVLRRLEADKDAELAPIDHDIRAAEDRKRQVLRDHKKRAKRIKRLVRDFAEDHKDEVCEGRRRSLQLNHGRIGWKKGGVKTRFEQGEEETLRLLRARAHDDCIIVKEKVDKNAVKGLPGSEAARCGVTFEQDEKLYIKLKPAEADELPGE